MSSNTYGGPPDPGLLVQGRMGPAELEMLMTYLLRHPGVFAEARQVLVAAHFDQAYELVPALLWQAACDLFDQYGSLPPAAALLADTLARVGDQPGAVPASVAAELRTAIDVAYGVDPASLQGEYQAYGFDLLTKFLRERHFADHARRVVAELGPNTPVDVAHVIEDLQARQAQVAGAAASAIEPLGAELTGRGLRLRPTGLPFLDLQMGGGAADGEVYGILGTYGSGKTMLAGNIIAEAANHALNEARAAGRPPRQCFYFTYETPPDDIRKRIWAYSAFIRLDKLDSLPYSTTLTRAGNRDPYENELFPTDPRGEWERFEDTAHLRRIINIADMRGPRHNPKAGSGGVEEIAAELTKYRARYGVTPDTVVIDYALVCVRRLIKARGWDADRKLRHLVGDFGDDCRRLIADRFGCQVWVLNQLSGEANKKAPGAKFTHADSAEARNFAENLWYCFWLGNKNRGTNTLALGCSKTRRSEGVEDAVVELRGQYARFVCANDRYSIDPHTRRIVKKSTGETVAAAPAARARPAATRGGLNPGSAFLT